MGNLYAELRAAIARLNALAIELQLLKRQVLDLQQQLRTARGY